MNDFVQRDDFDGWAQLTVDRPEKLNALTVGPFAELRRHVTDLNADDGVRCAALPA